MNSMSSDHNHLKRGCSSLSTDNVCSACHKSFSAPQYLDKHQRSHCENTTQELDDLRRRLVEIEHRKRRRFEEPAPEESRGANSVPYSASSITSHTHGTSSLSGAQGASSSNNVQPITSPAQSPQHALGNDTGYAPGDSSTPRGVQHKRGDGSVTSGTTTRVNSANACYLVDTSPLPAAFVTDLNVFRLRKRFYHNTSPLHDPDNLLSTTDCYDSTHHNDPGSDNGSDSNDDPGTPSYEPFPNLSSFELGEWFYGQGIQKSLKDFKALVDILKSPDFSVDDIKNTKWTRVFQDLGKNKEELNPKKSQWVDDAGWKATDIKIEVPIHNRMKQGRGVETHVAGKLFHRSIASIVEEKIRNAEDSRLFHYSGHELLWKPDPSDDSPEFRVISELYHSDAFLRAQKEVNESPPPNIKDCALPRVVVGVMFWSDATHVSTFSTSKLWPLYMLFANESKHHRTKSGSDLCNHVAYFDALSDSFKDYITGRTDGKIPPNLMAHLNREYAHAQWEIILDDELLKAIVEGLVIKCCDGIWRRFFIRIFTYSTDYPERVLMATIKARGDCPCVRCLVQKKNLNQTGTAEDIAFREAHPRVDSQARQDGVMKARNAIESGLAVGGDKVFCFISHSGVPTINAFSKRLGQTGFDIHKSLVADPLHEFEVGVFKALFIHLIRILDAFASGSTLIHELDRRYRSMPTFNKTIRKFSANASGLKRRAARDYEDLLQCAIPVFDGLLTGPLNDLVLKLLFLNARWHALAKLRMHSEATIVLLEEVTTQLGVQYRVFVKDTAKINTVERQSEVDKRTKAANKKQGRKTSGDSNPPLDARTNPPSVSTARANQTVQTSYIPNLAHPATERSGASMGSDMGCGIHAGAPSGSVTGQASNDIAVSIHASSIPANHRSAPLHGVISTSLDPGTAASELAQLPLAGQTSYLRPRAHHTLTPTSTSYWRADNFSLHPNHPGPIFHAHLPQNYPLQGRQQPYPPTVSYSYPSQVYPSQSQQHGPLATFNRYAPQNYGKYSHQPRSHAGMIGHSRQVSTQSLQQNTGFDAWQHALPGSSYVPPVGVIATTASGMGHVDDRFPAPAISHDHLLQATVNRAEGSTPSLHTGHLYGQAAGRSFASAAGHNRYDPYDLLQAPLDLGQGRSSSLPTGHFPSHTPGNFTVNRGCSTQSTTLLATTNMTPTSGASPSTAPTQPVLASTTTQAPATTATVSNGRRSKKLNLHTVKFHALGHYPEIIRHFGPTDLYTTEWGEFFHKSPKAWTKQTSRKQLRMELSRHERRRKRLQRTKYRILSTGQSAKSQEFREQRTAARNPDIHHFIGLSTRLYVALGDFSSGGRFSSDVASHMFVRNLKQYLLPRFVPTVLPHLTGPSLESFLCQQDWSRLVLKKDRIYTHQVMRLKYTTYDTRRDEDIIHLDTSQCNVMLMNPKYERSNSLQHPFLYGKVIAICHADVGYVGDMGRSGSQFVYHRVEFLWVRWYRFHPASTAFQLDQAELLSPDEPESHSFIDPVQVLRACHIIPCYREGKRYASGGKGKSELAQDVSDWKRYYINRFVDRDMFMRYEWGLAVGHTYTHADSVSVIQGIMGRKAGQETAQRGPPDTVQIGEGSGAAVASMVTPGDAIEPVADDAQISHTGLNSGNASGDISFHEDLNVGGDEDGDEEEGGGSDNESIATDATSLRGYSDDEEERMMSLFGRDW